MPVRGIHPNIQKIQNQMFTAALKKILPIETTRPFAYHNKMVSGLTVGGRGFLSKISLLYIQSSSRM